MATTTAKTGLVKNNGGTVAMGGNISTTGPITNAPLSDILGYHNPYCGSQIPAPETAATIAAGTDTKFVYKPYSSGRYAEMRVGEFVIIRASTKIAGVDNSAFASGAGDFGRRSINWKTYMRTVKVNLAGWTVNWKPARTPTWLEENVSFGADKESSGLSRALPGRLAYYKNNSGTVTTANYPAITT